MPRSPRGKSRNKSAKLTKAKQKQAKQNFPKTKLLKQNKSKKLDLLQLLESCTSFCEKLNADSKSYSKKKKMLRASDTALFIPKFKRQKFTKSVNSLKKSKGSKEKPKARGGKKINKPTSFLKKREKCLPKGKTLEICKKQKRKKIKPLSASEVAFGDYLISLEGGRNLETQRILKTNHEEVHHSCTSESDQASGTFDCTKGGMFETDLEDSLEILQARRREKDKFKANHISKSTSSSSITAFENSSTCGNAEANLIKHERSSSSESGRTDSDVSSSVFERKTDSRAIGRLSAGSSETDFDDLLKNNNSPKLKVSRKDQRSHCFDFDPHKARVKKNKTELDGKKVLPIFEGKRRRELCDSDSDDLKSNVSFVDETNQQKRARIARNYIEHLDRSCRSNTSEISICFNIRNITEPFTINEGKSSPIKLAINSNGSYLYSCNKKGALIKWSLEKRAKIAGLPFVKRNKINNVAISFNDKFIAISDSCGKIQIWTADVLKRKRVLQGHQTSVTGLKFHKSQLILYSTGFDKTLNIWCVKKMILLQSLKAHTGPIVCLDLYNQELLITGGCDFKVIIWKIPERKHTIYKEHTSPVLAVKFLKEDYFISGDSNGQLTVWNSQHCKSLCSLKEAHGCNKLINKPFPIYSIAYAKEWDFLITGSNSDFLILFKFCVAERKISCMHKVRLFGFVNDLVLSTCESCLIAAVGKESIFGDGKGCNDSANNCIFVMPIKMFE